MTRLNAFLTTIILCWSGFAWSAGVACESVFLPRNHGPIEAIGDVHEPKYLPVGTVTALKRQRIQNQCGTSECYLFSYVGMLEVANMNILNRADAPSLSAPYLYAQKLIEWANYRAWNYGGYTSRSLKGGYFYDSLGLARQHGLVPESSWQPKVPFEQWDFARIYREVESIAIRKSAEIEGSRATNALGGDLNELRKQRYFAALPYLKETIEKWSGPLPTEVDYRGSKVNVAKVEREFGIDHRAHVELMYPEAKFSYTANDLEVGFKNSVQAYGGSWRYHGKPQLEIESKIVKWVNSGAPVMVELDWGAHSHAMIIVGHEDRNGFVHRWKMQNSWGDRWSDNGSAWYSVEDLRNNLRGAYFVGWGTSQ